jgi:mannosyltransferase
MGIPRFVRQRAFQRLLLPLIIAFGTFLQFFRITSYSLGFDESYSVYLTHFKVSKLLLYTSKDSHPPLFYLMLKTWSHFFGDSVLAVRSLSAIFMILAIPTGFLIVKELFNKRAAYLAALFLAIGPFMVRYGHEARMYAPLVFFTLLATHLLIMTVRKRLPGWVGFSAYALAMIAAVYTHYYAFLILPSQWILVMVLHGQKIALGNCWKNLRVKGWLLSQAAILLAFLPWLPFALAQFGKVEGAFWLPPVQWKTVPATFLNFTAYQADPGFNYGLSVVFLALLIATLILLYGAIKRQLIDKKLLLFVVSIIAVGPVLIFILSIGRSIYYDRYFINSAVFFYILLGIVFAQSYKGRQKLLQISGIIAILLLFSVGITRVDRPQYDNVSLLMSTINAKSPSRDYQVVVLDHTLYYQTEYYDHGSRPAQITQFASLGGYGGMFPVRDNPKLVAPANIPPGVVWVIYYAKNGSVTVPKNWRSLSKVSVDFGVQAREYQVGTI